MYLQSRVYAKSTKLFESQMISVRNQEFGVYSAEQALTQLRSAVGGGGAAWCWLGILSRTAGEVSEQDQGDQASDLHGTRMHQFQKYHLLSIV